MELERVLGLLMMAGTVTSLVLIALGISLYVFQQGGGVSVSEQWVVRGRSFLDLLVGIGDEQSLPLLLMRSGVAILMLTPYSRALTSLVYFAVRRDWKFTAITGLVVATLSALLLLPASPS